MKVLSNFFLAILLDKKRGGNSGTFGKKVSSKADLVIFPLHNSSEDAFLLFPLYPQILSSCFCLPAAKSGIGIFGKENTRKSKKDNPRSTGANTDGGSKTDNPGTKRDVDAKLTIQAQQQTI